MGPLNCKTVDNSQDKGKGVRCNMISAWIKCRLKHIMKIYKTIFSVYHLALHLGILSYDRAPFPKPLHIITAIQYSQFSLQKTVNSTKFLWMTSWNSFISFIWKGPCTVWNINVTIWRSVPEYSLMLTHICGPPVGKDKQRQHSNIIQS